MVRSHLVCPLAYGDILQNALCSVINNLLWRCRPGAEPAAYYKHFYLAALSCESINHDDIIDRYSQHRSQDDHVVDGRHGCSVDPLVDRLRSCETEDHLHILYGHSGLDSQSVNVRSGCGCIYEWHIHHIDHLHLVREKRARSISCAVRESFSSAVRARSYLVRGARELQLRGALTVSGIAGPGGAGYACLLNFQCVPFFQLGCRGQDRIAIAPFIALHFSSPFQSLKNYTKKPPVFSDKRQSQQKYLD